MKAQAKKPEGERRAKAGGGGGKGVCLVLPALPVKLLDSLFLADAITYTPVRGGLRVAAMRVMDGWVGIRARSCGFLVRNCWLEGGRRLNASVYLRRGT